jgi:hypothetical protein
LEELVGPAKVGDAREALAGAGDEAEHVEPGGGVGAAPRAALLASGS